MRLGNPARMVGMGTKHDELPCLWSKMIVFTKMPLNDWNMLLGYVFSSELLKILVIPPNMVLGVGKHNVFVFGRKLLGTLEVVLLPKAPPN
jgi:hypothetical protein